MILKLTSLKLFSVESNTSNNHKNIGNCKYLKEQTSKNQCIQKFNWFKRIDKINKNKSFV